jgi:polyhydroxyalkanoate synthase subunit PhaE
MAKADAAGADLFAIGKQFWDTWSGFAQGAASGQTPAWGDPLAVFARAVPEAAGEARHAAESLAEQGRQFFDFLQAAASRMGVGEALDAGQVAELWRKTVAEGNPLLEALRGASAQGSRGFEQLQADLLPWLGQLRGALNEQLGLPAFGFSRERQEQLQALLQAQAEYVEANARYQALLGKAGQRGMEYFENKLAERSEPGRQVDSARALYDLWVDAAEDAYAEVALSPEFRAAYGAMVNALMRLRQRVQKEAELQAASLGMPTRSELDGTHRKLHELRAEVRALRRELAALRGGAGAASAPERKPAPTAQTTPPKAPAAKPAAAPRRAKGTPASTAPRGARKPTRSKEA